MADRWAVALTASGNAHVFPQDDRFDHLVNNCPCEPADIPVSRGDGTLGWVTKHNERQETTVAHEPHLDHPGEISWYVGHGPAPILGDCPHVACEHRDSHTVAWGPDFEHYELVVCVETGEGKCGGACRGWAAAYPKAGFRADGLPRTRRYGFRAFDAAGEHLTTREERKRHDAEIARDRAVARAAAR